MRKTDKIAKEKFNGDIKQAIKFILWNYEYEELDKFVFEWTKEELRIASKLIDEAPDIAIDEQKNTKNLNLTKEEVANAKKNPFKATIAKQILTLLIVNGGIISLATILQNSNIQVSQSILEAMVIWIPSVFTTYMSMKIGPNLFKYFKYQKVKKQCEQEKIRNNFNESEKTEGKVL